jgi:hypothetical protein
MNVKSYSSLHPSFLTNPDSCPHLIHLRSHIRFR